MQKEIEQDFTNDGLFRVKRLAKEPGQMPEAKKSLSFGGANVNSVNNRSQLNVTFASSFGLLQAPLCLPLSLLLLLALAPVALLSSHCFLIPMVCFKMLLEQ